MYKKIITFSIILLLLTIIFTGCSSAVPANTKEAKKVSKNEKQIKIALFLTRSKDDLFWSPFRDFMAKACSDLGMKLNVYYAEGNHLNMISQVKQNLSGFYEKPDIIVFPDFKGAGKFILPLCEEAKMPVFVVNSSFHQDDNMGLPREKYKYWIGEMTPDDESAGKLLADILISKAAIESVDKNIHIFSMEGNISDSASITRKSGLLKSISSFKGNESLSVRLEQNFVSNWDFNTAAENFTDIRKGYDYVPLVVWSASDGMALGVISSAKKMKLSPGRDIITGGVDWSREGLEGVKRGDLAATIGGHFMEGGWTAVMIYDYFNGIDFASENIKIRSKMYAITEDNVDQYMIKLSPENLNKTDFTKFSKKLNPALSKYDFSF